MQPLRRELRDGAPLDELIRDPSVQGPGRSLRVGRGSRELRPAAYNPSRALPPRVGVHPRVRGRAFLLFGAVVALAAAASLFLVSSGGRPGDRPGSSRSLPAGGRAGGPTLAANPEDKPLREPAERSTLEIPGPTSRDDVVSGRLAMSDGSPPPAEAVVRAVTGDRRIDHPETIALLGGGEAYERLARGSGLLERVRSADGWTWRFQTASRPDGSFQLTLPRDLPEFRFEVEADLAAHLRERRFAPDSPELAEVVTLLLDPVAKVEGALVDAEGRPVRGGRVSLWEVVSSPVRHRPFQAPRRVDADDAGRFVFRGVVAGAWGVTALSSGFGVATREVTAVAGKATRADLVLPREGAIAGRVVDEAGRGVPDARVQASPPRAPSGLSEIDYGVARSREDGAFRIGSLRPGPHHLHAEKEGLLPGRTPERMEVPEAGEVATTVVLTEGHHVSGRVVEATGAPVPGAEIDVSPDRRSGPGAGVGRGFERRWAASGSDGTFRVTGLDGGPYEIAVRQSDVATVFLRNVASDTEGLEVRIPGPTGIAGRVVDATGGVPLRRFRVRLERVERGAGWISHAGDADRRFVDEGGAFQLLDLRPAEYRVRAWAEGFVEGKVEGIEVAAGSVREGVEIRLERGASVRGKVLAADSGEPIAHAQIEMERKGPRSTPYVRAQSAVDGSFELSGVRPGIVRLEVSHDSFLGGNSDSMSLRPGEALEGLIVSLARGGAVEGSALDDSGVPLKGSVQAVPPGGGAVKYARLDSGGLFRLEGLVPGDWSLALEVERPVQDPGIEEGPVDSRIVRVAEREIARVDFTRDSRETTCRVEGRVTRDGLPVAGAGIRLLRKAEGGGFLSFAAVGGTARDGTFAVERVPPGEIRVRVEVPAPTAEFTGRASFEVETAVPEAREHRIEVQVPTGGIAGIVRNAEAGKPIAWATIEAERVGEGESSSGNGTAAAAEDGRYRLLGLPAGSYRVTARGPEGERFAPRSLGVEVVDGAVATVEFLLEEEEVVLIEVVDEGGRPVADRFVTLHRVAEAGEEGRGQVWATDSTGVARPRAVEPGVYYAAAGDYGRGVGFSDVAEVRAGRETRFRVRLVGGVEARVRVIDGDGREVAGACVSFLDGEKRRVDAYLRKEEGVRSERRAACARLATGEYLLRVSAEGFHRREQTVEVAEPSPWEFVVRLEREAPR